MTLVSLPYYTNNNSINVHKLDNDNDVRSDKAEDCHDEVDISGDQSPCIAIKRFLLHVTEQA